MDIFDLDSPAVKIDDLRVIAHVDDNDLKEELQFEITRGLCWHVVFSPDENYFAWICNPKKIILVPWDSRKGTVERPPSLPSNPYSSEGDTRFISDRNNPNGNGTRSWIHIECGYPVLSIAFGSGTPQSSGIRPPRLQKSCWTRFDFTKEIVFATGHTNGRIRIWNAYTGNLLLELMDHKSGVRDLSFAPDGSLRLISASLDKTLKGWDLNDDGNMFKTFFAHQNSVLWCCWSPNAKLMASAGSDKTVFIWDMVNYTVVRRLDGHLHEVVSCSFSPDGAVIATASWDSQVNLWDPYTGKRLRSLYHLHPPPKMIYACGANSAWVRGVSYSLNGCNIATIADDHLIRFWNLLGESDPEGLATEDEDALSCVYSPSGRRLAVGTTKFNVNFYSIPAIIPSLAHLSRMSIRKMVVTSNVEKLDIPSSLKSYLKYEVWK